MTDTPAPATVDQLVEQATGDYRALCHGEGVDPDVELLEARLVHEADSRAWIACRLTVGRARTGAGWFPAAFRACSLPRQLPPGVFALLARSDRPANELNLFVRRADCPPIVLDAFADHPDPDVRVTVVAHLSTPQATLERLTADPDDRVVGRVCVHPNTPSWILERLYAERPEFHSGLAQRVPPALGLVDRLAKHPDWWVRVALARAADGHLIAIDLATDPSEQVRKTLALNRELHPAAVAILARDGMDLVRADVAARNDDTIDPHLPVLAGDRSARVRAAVARNPRTPRELVERLAHDPKPSVARASRKRLDERT